MKREEILQKRNETLVALHKAKDEHIAAKVRSKTLNRYEPSDVFYGRERRIQNLQQRMGAYNLQLSKINNETKAKNKSERGLGEYFIDAAKVFLDAETFKMLFQSAVSLKGQDGGGE